jgi:hypothetical protein
VAEHYGERGIAEEDKTTILKVMDSFLKDAQLAHTHKKLK